MNPENLRQNQELMKAFKYFEKQTETPFPESDNELQGNFDSNYMFIDHQHFLLF